MFRTLRSCIAMLAGLAFVALIAGHAEANWLTRLGTVASETGGVAGKAARLGLSALDRAAAAAKAHPAGAKTAALAAHVTPEGHWKFVNGAGEVFTAGTPEELTRAIPQLLPEVAEGKAGLTLYLTEGTVFEGRDRLKDLPKTADLKVVANDETYRLVKRKSAAGADALYAEVRPNIAVEMNDLSLFDEALWQLQRPLNKADIRVVALEPGGPEKLVSTPRFEPGSTNALVDAIDPGRLAASLPKLKGQTVLLTGAIEGGSLRFTPARGGSETLRLKDVIAAAEDADVNLVLLDSSAPRQPGGRNWLWQRVAVKGLDEAIRRATYADFLNALAANRGQLLVTASEARGPRVQLTAIPTGAVASPVSGGLADWAANWASEMTGHVTGEVLTLAVHAHVMSSERQKEMDARIVRFLPAWVQGYYLVGIAAGLIAWRISAAWWRRLWPEEARSEYARAIGFYLAKAVRFLAYLLIFLPLAGIPALFAMLAHQLWDGITLPVRLWRRMRGGAKAA